MAAHHITFNYVHTFFKMFIAALESLYLQAKFQPFVTAIHQRI